jgi:hypothetical protein
VRYNFLKYRARQAQAEVRASGVRAVDLDRFDELLRDAEKTRGQIVAGMLPVVLSVVRRQLAAGDDTIEAELIEMLGRGLTVLLDEIERFDPALSHTLESVLTNRLLRVLASAKPVAGALSAERLAQRIEAAGVEWDAADDA